MSKLLLGSVSEHVLKAHFVLFCVIFQRGNISTVNFRCIGGKVDSQVTDPVPVEGLKSFSCLCCVLGRSSS